jgi:alkanesulfonate monooxygenase SsuD/methylene tetrahydromethanopterin reductase-like flavin-dependent oxidoreductase (luciferase family)
VAEDAAVLDSLSGGRLELGLGSGGATSAFVIFGLGRRGAVRDLPRRRRAGAGRAGRAPAQEHGTRLHPGRTRLLEDIRQATFSPAGGARIRAAGSACCSRATRPEDAPRTRRRRQGPAADRRGPTRRSARPVSTRGLGAPRSVLVGRDGGRLRALARDGALRFAAHLRRVGQPAPTGPARGNAQRPCRRPGGSATGCATCMSALPTR